MIIKGFEKGTVLKVVSFRLTILSNLVYLMNIVYFIFVNSSYIPKKVYKVLSSISISRARDNDFRVEKSYVLFKKVYDE